MYQALYRKWRPRTFDDVIGQAQVTETLKTQVQTGRLSHAYLFIGTRGTGKTTCAKILAKAVNCEHPVNGNPCNECSSCRGIDDGSILDVVEMDAASNNGVDNVRQLRDEAVFSPATVKKRVYIIDEVHMLSINAFNALLKILEEPPEHLMFILATTELNKVPATILSRCQRHRFKRLDSSSILERLNYVAAQEQLNLTPDAAALITSLSEGGMRDALSILDQCAGRETIDTDAVYSAMGLAGNRETAQLLLSLLKHDTAKALLQFQTLWENGKDPAALLGELSTLQRDILMCRVAPAGGRELLSGGYDDKILNYFKDRVPSATLMQNIETIRAAIADMRNGQPRIACELCLIALSEPELGDGLPALRRRVTALEERLSGTGFPAAAPGPKPVETKAVPLPEPEPERPPLPEEAPPETPGISEEPFPEPVKTAGKPAEPEKPASMPAGASVQPAAVSRTVPAASVSSGQKDSELLSALRSALPGGLFAAVSEAELVPEGDCLRVVSDNAFVKGQLDRPDTLAKIAATASTYYGRAMHAAFFAPDADSDPAAGIDTEANLEALKQYEIVKFK